MFSLNTLAWAGHVHRQISAISNRSLIMHAKMSGIGATVYLTARVIIASMIIDLNFMNERSESNSVPYHLFRKIIID